MTECPKCNNKWKSPCEQTACIKLFGECISCRKFLLTEEDIKQIQDKAALRSKNT